MAELIVLSGKHQGKKLTFPDREIVFGRDKSCNILLSSDQISRRHCMVKPSANGLLLVDLGSRNGTYVNDRLVDDEHLLRPGDVIRLGSLKFQVPKDPSAPQESDDSHDRLIAGWLSDDYSPEDAEGDTAVIDMLPPPETSE